MLLCASRLNTGFLLCDNLCSYRVRQVVAMFIIKVVIIQLCCWATGAVAFNTLNGIKRFGKLHKAKGLIQIVLTEVVIIGLMYGSQMLCILLTRKPVPRFLHKLNYAVIFHLILPHKIFYPVGNGKAFFQRPSGLMIPSLRQWKRKTQKNNLPP